MTRNPEPRPALRKAGDAGLHPAAPRVVRTPPAGVDDLPTRGRRSSRHAAADEPGGDAAPVILPVRSAEEPRPAPLVDAASTGSDREPVRRGGKPGGADGRSAPSDARSRGGKAGGSGRSGASGRSGGSGKAGAPGKAARSRETGASGKAGAPGKSGASGKAARSGTAVGPAAQAASGKTVKLVVALPKELRKPLKKRAASQGCTPEEATLLLVRNWLTD